LSAIASTSEARGVSGGFSWRLAVGGGAAGLAQAEIATTRAIESFTLWIMRPRTVTSDRNMPNPRQWAAAKARQTLYASLRETLSALGYEEVETPALVPRPGMEPHINAFEVHFIPEMDSGPPSTLYLHTSPEYAMKRLLAEGAGPIFQICKVFRNGELSESHNPEFSMLEFYRPGADYHRIMEDLETLLAKAEAAVNSDRRCFTEVPYQRLSFREAILNEAGIDLRRCADAASLREEARRAGILIGEASSFEDLLLHAFLQKVEAKLGFPRPTFLLEYPAPMASLARLKPGDPSVAERFELYAEGTELANGFSELTDAREQRRRLIDEQAQRRAASRPVYPLDEKFLDAVSRLPPCAGVALGLDRLLMTLLQVDRIEDVLLFPANQF
jgi:lysyl-tRNA synthetase class 2